MHLAEGRADIFLTYCTNGIVVRGEVPGLRVVAMPPELAVGAEYGMTLVACASGAARAFHDFALSRDGHDILAAHGFSPVR